MLSSINQALTRRDWAGARQLCGDALRERGDVAALHHARGLSYVGEQAFAAALPCLARAHDLERAAARWARDLAAVQATLGRHVEAMALLEPHLASLDSGALALYLTVAVSARRTENALAALEAARPGPLPDDSQFLFAHGVALETAGRHREAESILAECLRRDPGGPQIHEALAFVYDGGNEPEREIFHSREYLRLSPDSVHARVRLALACGERGLRAESRALRIEAQLRGITRPHDHSAALYLMLADPDDRPADLVTAARRAFAGRPPVAPGRTRPRRGGHRVRVGYVSGECRATPAYYFYRPFLAHHDRTAVEVFVYCCNPMRDRVTGEYRGWAEHWRDCARHSDDELAAAIARDDIDVVVDLSGHFIFNRLTALAGRLAPWQAAYPNYPSTTGCPNVDYLLTDEWTSPPGSGAEYTEALHRLPSGYLMYAPPEAAPAVTPLPLLADGIPTFGMFQRLGKFNGRVWDAVAAVLTRVPHSRLLIQNADRELDRPDSETSRSVLQELDRRGVDPRRVTLKGPLAFLPHLDAVSRVDVALDTFPYTGQTTTCESLWMGVPVVTWPQDTHVSRVSAGLLTRAGHGSWIARSAEDYAGIAAALVAQPDRLSVIRQRLRQDVVDAGLTDGPRLARALEAAYRAWVGGADRASVA